MKNETVWKEAKKIRGRNPIRAHGLSRKDTTSNGARKEKDNNGKKEA